MALIKHGNNALANITTFPSAVPTGKPVLISSATASSSASIEFTSGIDSTYDVYQFEFINIHPATDGAKFEFNGSTDGGSNYNVVKTTTSFRALVSEAGTSEDLSYVTGGDLAQSTSNQVLTHQTIGNDADQSAVGYLQLFNPSSTTYVKHFIARTNASNLNDFTADCYYGGYFNNISAIDAVKFVMSSGNIDAGTIKMYGISA